MYTVEQYGIFLVLPTLQVIVALCGGLYCIKRSKATRGYAIWSVGVSLIAAGLLSIAGLIWVFVAVGRTYSWGVLVIGIAPFLPIATVCIGTLIMLSGLTVWGRYNPGFVKRRRLVFSAGNYRLWLSTAVLTATFAGLVVFVLPYLHQLPYQSFSSEGSIEGDTQILKFKGWDSFSDNSDTVFIVKSGPWPEYEAQLSLRLNWRGNALLKIRRIKAAAPLGEIKTYYLPLDDAVYTFNDGLRTDGG